MENVLIQTGISVTAHSNIGNPDNLTKEIYGSITLEYVSCGDMSRFVDENGEFNKPLFFDALLKKVNNKLGESIQL